MIETTSAAAHRAPESAPRYVLKMVEGDRTAGSMPVWERASAPEAPENREALGNIAPAVGEESAFAATLAAVEPEAAEEDSFGFGDLIDVINPLQHIPLVSKLYRSVTGDEIGPSARVIGGTLFGGPVGGAVSLANVIVEEETGKDIAGNVFALAAGESTQTARIAADNPEERLNHAVALAQLQNDETFPASAIAFADLGGYKPAPTRPLKIVWKLND